MATSVRFLPQADRDVVDRIAYFLKIKDLDLADRWYSQVLATCAALARNPTAHPAFELRRPRYTGTRCELVDGFPTDLIVYRPADHGIDVIRVVSGFRDQRRL